MTDQLDVVPHGTIENVNLSFVMNQAYIDYAVSVISGRAIPDLRDGFKNVHRRVLYAMYGAKNFYSGPYKKSARMVGDTIGKYHPHGDTSVYDAAVRMAQPFSMAHTLIDGQGNFGSIDGDSPAAMRYTEMRLDKLSSKEFFNELEKESVDWRPNYDEHEIEPVVLPVTYPNLLVNGTEGIAVGMATSIPPHNLSSVIDATKMLINNTELDTASLMSVLEAPDFPTGATVYDLDGFANAIESGRGGVKLRSKWHEEERRSGTRLVIDEIPYQVNKEKLVVAIARLVNEKKIENIVALRDESGKKGIRIAMDIKKDGSAEVVFAQLCSMTNLEVSINYNCVVLDKGQPKTLGLKDLILKWIDFRREVVVKSYIYDRKQAQKKKHILDGYMKAMESKDRLDEVVSLIRSAKSGVEAKSGLVSLLGIDEIQAQAILDLRLQKLTGMEIEAIRAEHKKYEDLIAELTSKIESPEKIDADIVETLDRVKNDYGISRRTEIGYGLSSMEREDLIPREDVLITMSQGGYLKRMNVNALNVQNRGTRGKKSVEVKDEDELRAMYQVNSHDMLLVFGESGQVYGSKAYSIPSAKLTDKGRHIKNIIEDFDENINTILAIPEQDEESFVVSVTRQGKVKRSSLENYSGATRKGGVKGMNTPDGDSLFRAFVCNPGDTLMLISSAGKAVRFSLDALRNASRTSGGVTGMTLTEDQTLVGAYVVDSEQDDYLMCVGENGIGKRTKISEFSVKGRGGKGMAAFKVSKKTGSLTSAIGVKNDQDVVITMTNGVSNKISVEQVAISGRDTSGVKLINPDEGSQVLSVTASVRMTSDEGAGTTSEMDVNN